jgi:O-succinylbenzoic acid--CoA ligase
MMLRFLKHKPPVQQVLPKQLQDAIESAKSTIRFLDIHPSDTAFLCLSPTTIGGKMMLVRSSVNNMKLYITPPASNPLREIKVNIDFIAIAPIQLATILAETPEKLKTIRNIIVGGGIISENIVEELQKHQLTIFQTFGMTETISHIAMRKVGFVQEEYYTTLSPATISESKGNLCIHAPHLGIEELITNDAVEIINERQFKWLGRTDFVINSGGIKIQIEELENALQTHINQKFFIHKKTDSTLGEKVVLIIEGNESEKYTNKAFYSFIENHYHIPKEIAFIKRFILTPSDKINRIANFERLNEHGFKQIL